jgi:acetate kinase
VQASIVSVNAGSSSIKLAVFGAEEDLPLWLTAQVDGIGSRPTLRLRGADGAALAPVSLPAENADHAELAAFLLTEVVRPRCGSPLGIGHRVVHGGTRYREPQVVTPEVMDGLEALVPLARSHQPHNLAGMRAAATAWPGTPQVACFDTAFHATLPEAEWRFPIPAAFSEQGIRRYGFHGLSYEAIARQLPEVLGPLARGPVVVAHLGNGASLCGMVELESRSTTMGFTPLDGLMMGRRPGRLDPGVLLHLVAEKGMDAEALSELLNNRCGLFGLSGGVSDMRELLASDAPAAQLAVDMFVRRLAAEIAATATAIGGLAALVFTGGIGENAAAIRALTVARLAWLGAKLDGRRNEAGGPEIGAPGGAVRLLVLRTDEERVIARAVAGLVSGPTVRPASRSDD